MGISTRGLLINNKVKKDNSVAANSPKGMTERKRYSPLANFVIRLIKEKPLGVLGAAVTMVLLITGIFANYLAPYGMNQIFPTHALEPPSAQFWLGTDNLGRDLLSRIIFGARISVIVGLTATFISTVVSTFMGILSAYIGGIFDLILQRFVDAVMCLPSLVLLMVIISIIGPGMWQVIVCLGIAGGIAGSRMIRGIVIGMKENMYVGAATATGNSTARILTRHILPNIMPSIIIIFSIGVPGAILAEAGLSFLGFGIPAPTPSWGGMLSGRARAYMFQAPWMALWPGLALTIMVYSVSMFGDAVRDLLDPRLTGGTGRYGVRVKKVETLKSKP